MNSWILTLANRYYSLCKLGEPLVELTDLSHRGIESRRMEYEHHLMGSEIPYNVIYLGDGWTSVLSELSDLSGGEGLNRKIFSMGMVLNMLSGLRDNQEIDSQLREDASKLFNILNTFLRSDCLNILARGIPPLDDTDPEDMVGPEWLTHDISHSIDLFNPREDTFYSSGGSLDRRLDALALAAFKQDYLCSRQTSRGVEECDWSLFSQSSLTEMYLATLLYNSGLREGGTTVNLRQAGVVDDLEQDLLPAMLRNLPLVPYPLVFYCRENRVGSKGKVMIRPLRLTDPTDRLYVIRPRSEELPAIAGTVPELKGLVKGSYSKILEQHQGEVIIFWA